MKWTAFVGLALALSGCVFSAKLSASKAQELLFSDLQGGAAGAVVKPVSADLNVEQVDEGASASASGTIEAQALQDTFRVLGTIQLPENRSATEIMPQLRAGDKKVINVSARFVHADNGWQLNGPAQYSLRVGDLGKTLAAISNPVDMSTESGKKLPLLLAEYNRQVDSLSTQDKRLDRLKELYLDYVDSQRGPSFYTYGFSENQLQELFPDEVGLAEKLHETGSHGASPFERYQQRNQILEPIFQRNIQAATAARDAAKQQADAISVQLRAYGS